MMIGQSSDDASVDDCLTQLDYFLSRILRLVSRVDAGELDSNVEGFGWRSEIVFAPLKRRFWAGSARFLSLIGHDPSLTCMR